MVPQHLRYTSALCISDSKLVVNKSTIFENKTLLQHIFVEPKRIFLALLKVKNKRYSKKCGGQNNCLDIKLTN